MYNIEDPLYNYSITELLTQADNHFILNGASCTINYNNDISKQKNSAVMINNATVSSGGFSTSGKNEAATQLSLSNTGDNVSGYSIVFVFKHEYESKLSKDIEGVISYDGIHWILEINTQTAILDFIPHIKSSYTLDVGDFDDMTIEKLREVLGYVRACYYLDELDKMHDYFIFNTPQGELNTLALELERYIAEIIDDDLVIDLCTKSSTDIDNTVLLNLSIRRKDSSKASRSLLKIELFPRKFEPAILMSAGFTNDNDPFIGQFTFLPASMQPLLFNKLVTMDEANFFIKRVLRIVSDLDNYKYVIDVTN